jgi:processive 1,2-diacylglycerol beta-glucosyltransferase
LRNATKKIAVFSVSVGAGHMRAAQALRVTLERDYPEHIVVEQDVLDLMPKSFRKLYRDLYLEMVSKSPNLFGWLYDQTDRPFKSDLVRQTFEKVNAGKFFDFVKDFNPELAICTHFLPASLLHDRRRKGKYTGQIATVVTDFDIHGMWLATPCDNLFVAGEEAKFYLQSFPNFDTDVVVSGVPTHPVFAKSMGREKAAEKLGLRSDLTTLLLSTGGFGVGNLEEILGPLKGCKHKLQLVVACGRNEELREKLAKQFAQPDWHFIGFTDKFDQYMECTDLMLGKPGGLTTWESFVKGVAWVVINPIPGQEERNTYHLLEEGVGLWAYEPRTLAFKIDSLLDNPEKLASMQKRSRALARPDSCQVILEKLLGPTTKTPGSP